MIEEPAKARLLRTFWRLTGRKEKVDRVLTSLLTYRRYLAECDAQDVIPRFTETEIRIRQCPLGTWSTPLIDVVVLLKAALGFESKRILELGSYRGDTARLLAENTPEDTVICAVDIDEQHGAAYRGQPIASKIRRKTGRIAATLFGPEEKFDLIFVDADHDFDSVMNDTQVAFKVLADRGVILWHDYAHDTYFHGMSGVPEALREFARQHAIFALRGTRLAIYSNAAGRETAKVSSARPGSPDGSVWREQQLRG